MIQVDANPLIAPRQSLRETDLTERSIKNMLYLLND
jgi:hypothetical protein